MSATLSLLFPLHSIDKPRLTQKAMSLVADQVRRASLSPSQTERFVSLTMTKPSWTALLLYLHPIFFSKSS